MAYYATFSEFPSRAPPPADMAYYAMFAGVTAVDARCGHAGR